MLFGHSIARKTHFDCIFKVSIFFCRNKKALELKIMIFENSLPKDILRQIMNNVLEILNAIRQELLNKVLLLFFNKRNTVKL